MLTRVFVTKKLLPDFLIDMALKKKLVDAYINPANPLLDDADILISACWDQLHAIFSWPFVGYTYVHKDLPGLSKWRDAAAAIFIAFVLNDETFYSQTARPTTEHPNRRPYQLYKKRRQNLDLHPHKRPVIRGASWDRYRDVLHVNSKADGWGWEIWRFFPTQNQRD